MIINPAIASAYDIGYAHGVSIMRSPDAVPAKVIRHVYTRMAELDPQQHEAAWGMIDAAADYAREKRA